MIKFIAIAISLLMNNTTPTDFDLIKSNYDKAVYVVRCKIDPKPFQEGEDLRRLYTLNATIIEDYKGKCPNREFLIRYHCDQPITRDTAEQDMINEGDVILYLTEDTEIIKSTITRTGEQYAQFEVEEIMHHLIYGEGRMMPYDDELAQFLINLK